MSRRLLLVPVLTAGLLAGALAAPAAAAPPTVLSGTTTVVASTGSPVVVPTDRAVPSAFGNVNLLTGGITGTAVGDYRCLTVRTTIRCQGVQVTTGTLAGTGSGTTTADIRFACDLTTGACQGFTVARSGTGALADLRARTTFSGFLTPTGGSFSYETRVLGS